jgi:hypothetical protein
MKKIVSFLYVLLVLLHLKGISGTGYVVGDLISNKTNGSWTTPSDWDIWNGSAAIAQSAVIPTSSTNAFILSGDTYTLPSTGVRECKTLTINTGGKLYTNVSSNRFLNVYGDILCDGTIGKGSSFDGISFNIEGASCTISGTGSLDCARIRKSSNTNAITSLLFDMNANLRFNGTALYNNSSSGSLFNITIAQGIIVTCPGDGTTNSGGSVAIDGIDGSGTGYMGGSITVNGTLTMSGTGTTISKLYLTTDNTNTNYPVAITIGKTGIINTPTIVCNNSSAAGSTFSIDSGGVLNITGEPSVYSSPGITNNSYSFLSGSTIEYSKSGNQTIYSFAAAHYPNLICSGGIKSLSASMIIDSTLTLSGTASLSIGNNTLTLDGNVSGTGTISGSSTSDLIINNNGSAYPNLNFTSSAAILYDFTLNSNAKASLGTALSIVAGSAAGSVTVAAGAILSTNNDLTLLSDANGTARVGVSAGTISGNVTVERYIPAHRGWRLLTAPFIAAGAPTINQAWQDSVSNTDRLSPINPYPGYGTEITKTTIAQNGYDQGSTNNPSIDYFTGSAWVALSATNQGAITDYPGYFLFVRGDRSIIVSNAYIAATETILHPKGQLLIGSKTISIPNAGLQVIGNPYASAINFNSVYNDNSSSGAIVNTYYLWDPELTGTNGVGAFVTLTDDGTGTGNYVYNVQPASPIDFHGRIESSSAFFINAIGAGTIAINESDKSSGSATVQRPALNIDPVRSIRTSLYSNNAGEEPILKDGALILFNNTFSDSITWQEDAMKLNNSSENISIDKNDHLISIEKRKFVNKNDTVVYNISQLHQQPYVLKLSANNLADPGLKASLYDNYTNISVPVNLSGLTTDNFTITADIASANSNRFKLIFNKDTLLTDTNGGQQDDSIPVIKNVVYNTLMQNGMLTLNWNNIPAGQYSISLFDNIGRLIFRTGVNVSSNNIQQNLMIGKNIAMGIYELEIISPNNERITNNILYPR